MSFIYKGIGTKFPFWKTFVRFIVVQLHKLSNFASRIILKIIFYEMQNGEKGHTPHPLFCVFKS